ncbi:N-acetylmuramoyl-L-alanine amidase, partial [Streptomyces sp. TRM76130]|nr:N-acetylmuramoyl-L-alanine amidase [Streptomyces sp. TRM76130]
GADPDTPERAPGRVRGATAPLWVGDADGVELRVTADDDLESALPEGLRLELVDPGGEEAEAEDTADYSPFAAEQVAYAKSKPYVGPRPG